MYQQFLRGCILKTGIGSIKMKSQEGKYESEKFVELVKNDDCR